MKNRTNHSDTVIIVVFCIDSNDKKQQSLKGKGKKFGAKGYVQPKALISGNLLFSGTSGNL